MVALTGLGLAAAAGLNAYIPFLVMALLARFTTVVQLPAGFEWMTSWWAIGIGALLLASDVLLDKIPAVDSLNDVVQGVLRPATGGLVFAASQAAADLESSSWMREHSWVGIVVGVLVAAAVHTTKATVRPMVNVATGGWGAPVVSTAEDGVSLGLSVVAVLVPVLVVVVLAVMVAVVVRLLRRRAARRRSSAAGG
ncbi:MAG: DUF4126 domain-containing protein [Actinobacteria bacterium]|nr:DUF4126 domain-containing protein [Actinomycetota bacterium]MCG2799907.1 DUF4126 domain-containing protein [Cellulomonas sp.]